MSVPTELALGASPTSTCQKVFTCYIIGVLSLLVEHELIFVLKGVLTCCAGEVVSILFSPRVVLRLSRSPVSEPALCSSFAVWIMGTSPLRGVVTVPFMVHHFTFCIKLLPTIITLDLMLTRYMCIIRLV